MNSIPIIVSLICALVIAAFQTWQSRRWRLVKFVPGPSYEQLGRSRDSAEFALTFSLMWILFSGGHLPAPLSLFGDWGGLVFMLIVIILRFTVQIIFWLIDRRYPEIKAPSA